MKRLFRAVGFLLVILWAVSFAKPARASHFYGADLYYTHVSGQTYTVTFAVYGDCAGGIFDSLYNSIPQVDVYKNTVFYTNLNLIRQGPGVEVTPVCPADLPNTACNGGSLPGVMRYIYSASVTLDGPNSNWRFRFNGDMDNSQAGRSNVITNISIPVSTGSVMNLEATLNNVDGPNSSAVYTTIPTPFFCINKPQNYNQGAVDPNGHTLSYALVPGLTPGGTVSYISPYTAIAPLATAAGTFSFSSTTGQMTFTPNLVQQSLVVGKVSEYNSSGTLVGTSMREMTFVVLSACTNNSPTGTVGTASGATMTGPYSVQVCGNQGAFSFSIPATDADGDVIEVTSAGLPTGSSFSVAGNNTTTPVGTFSWNTTGVAPGTYTFFVTYTDAGCPLSANQTIAYTVTVLPPPTVTWALVTPATCAKKAVFTITGSGGTTPYPFTITVKQGASTVITRSVASAGASTVTDSLVPGTYTIRYTDGAGCYGESSMTILPPTPPTATAVGAAPTCFGGSNGSVTISGAGGTPPYTYALGSGAFGGSATIGGLSAGIYAVSVKDANQCVTTVFVAVPNAPQIIPVVSMIKPICNVAPTGSITLAGSNGVAPYEYALNTGGWTTSGTFGSLAAGIYILHIRDAAGCLKDTAVYLADSLKISAPALITPILCNGGTGTVALSGTGTVAPYTYALGAGAAGASGTFTGLAAGSYTFHVEDVVGCYLDTTIALTHPLPLGLTAASVPASCAGLSDGTLLLTASGGTPGYTYSAGGAFGGSPAIGGLPGGLYTATVQDANGCTATDTQTVGNPPPLTIGVAGTMPSCAGGTNGSYTITAGGGTAPYFYGINGGAFGGSATFGGLAAGTYTLSILDGNGCGKDTVVTLGQPLPLAVAAAVDHSTCKPLNDGAVTLTAGGGTSPYTYAVGAGLYGTSAGFTALASGLYTFHVQDAKGCIKDTTFYILDSLNVNAIVAITPAVCYGGASGEINVGALGGATPYTYALGSGAYGTAATFSLLTAGTYTVHVQDVLGCKDDTTVSVSQPPQIGIAIMPTAPLCAGASNGALSIAASGGTPGYTYAMGSGAYGSSGTFPGLAAGPYVLHVQDAVGCVRDTAFNLIGPTAVVITGLLPTNILCHGDATGAVAVSVAGGTTPYAYSANGGPLSGLSTLINLPAGTHTIQVVDANGCAQDTTITLSEPPPLYFGPGSVTMPTCEGFADGAVTVSGAGGTPPYQYALGGGAWSASGIFPSLTEGAYTVTLRDAAGCEADTALELIGYPHILLDQTALTPVRCWGERNGAIVLEGSGGMGTLSYQMTRPALGEVLPAAQYDSLIAGLYTIRVTDTAGCRKDTTLAVRSPDVLKAEPAATNNDCEGLDIGGIARVDVTGGTEPYGYLWSGSTTSDVTAAQISGLQNGRYVVTVNDARGCADTAAMEISYDNCCKPFIPDAFTPNGDGRNDVYRILFKGDMELLEFSIYNRYGERVYSSMQVDGAWDGTHQGRPCDMGVYFWYVRMLCGNGRTNVLEWKGDVTLVR